MPAQEGRLIFSDILCPYIIKVLKGIQYYSKGFRDTLDSL